MEVTLNRRNPVVSNATDQIYGFFEAFMAERGYENLEELYEGEVPPPMVTYLFNLAMKLTSRGELTFSSAEREQLRRTIDTIPVYPAADAYPQAVKGALSDIDAELQKKMARMQGRNLMAANEAGIFGRGSARSTRPNSALNRLLGRNFFTRGVAGYLTDQPRATVESRGTIAPVIRNLRHISQGRPVSPLRPRGTGTRGGAKRKTRKNRSRRGRR